MPQSISLRGEALLLVLQLAFLQVQVERFSPHRSPPGWPAAPSGGWGSLAWASAAPGGATLAAVELCPPAVATLLQCCLVNGSPREMQGLTSSMHCRLKDAAILLAVASNLIVQCSMISKHSGTIHAPLTSSVIPEVGHFYQLYLSAKGDLLSSECSRTYSSKSSPTSLKQGRPAPINKIRSGIRVQLLPQRACKL